MKRGASILLCLMLTVSPVAAQDTDALMMRNIIDGVAPEDAAAGRFLADFADCAAADQQSRARDAMRRMPASDRSDADLYWIAMLSNSRSAERSVGKECVSTCRSRWLQYHYKKKQKNKQLDNNKK